MEKSWAAYICGDGLCFTIQKLFKIIFLKKFKSKFAIFIINKRFGICLRLLGSIFRTCCSHDNLRLMHLSILLVGL